MNESYLKINAIRYNYRQVGTKVILGPATAAKCGTSEALRMPPSLLALAEFSQILQDPPNLNDSNIDQLLPISVVFKKLESCELRINH